MSKQEKKRTFRERLRASIANINVPMPFGPDMGVQVIELMSGKAPVVWIQGQNCTGCTCSLLDSDEFLPGDLAFEKMSLRYQPTILAASGSVATASLSSVWEERPGAYVLVVEGAIPTGEFSQFCTFGIGKGEKVLMGNAVPDEVPITAWIQELAPDAAAVVAVGNCASFGGMPMSIAHLIGATPVPGLIAEVDPKKPVINITGCPPHPDWLVGTLEKVLLWVDGEDDLPELDERGRVKEYYSSTIHELCQRLPAFKEKRFLEDWNDTVEDEDRCLLKLGCMGPKTRGDCPSRLWNSQVDWCVSANSPCYGCTEPDFIEKMRHPSSKKEKE